MTQDLQTALSAAALTSVIAFETWQASQPASASGSPMRTAEPLGVLWLLLGATTLLASALSAPGSPEGIRSWGWCLMAAGGSTWIIGLSLRLIQGTRNAGNEAEGTA